MCALGELSDHIYIGLRRFVRKIEHLFLLCPLLTLSTFASAQVETNFASGGAVRIGDSTTTCDSSIEGAIRFDADGADTLDYCDGANWLSLLTSTVSGGIVNNGNSFAAAMVIGTNDNNTLAFETNGTTRMTIDTSGNVGIGTTTPLADLSFSNGIATGALDTHDEFKIQFFTNTSIPSHSYGIGIRSNTMVFNSGNDFHFDDKGSTVMVIDSGNVGIGSDIPEAALDVGTGTINAAQICDENNANCLDLSAGVGGGTPTLIEDTDQDTMIQVEESGDEDIIRMDVGGAQMFSIREAAFPGADVGNGIHLRVYGANQTDLNLKSGSSSNGHSRIVFGHSFGSNSYAHIGTNGADANHAHSMELSAYGDRDISLFTNSTERMTVLGENGNVGVGTSAPASTFNINGGTGLLSSGLTFGDGDSGFYESVDDALALALDGTMRHTFTSTYHYSNTGHGYRIHNQDPVTFAPANSDTDSGLGWVSADNIALFTGGTNRLHIDASGNVGIGTTSPSSELEIAGNILTERVDVRHDMNAPYSPTSALGGGGSLRVLNLNNNNSIGAKVHFQLHNSSANNQSAFISAISTAGAGSYTPEITIQQQTGSSTYAERIRIDTNGNVGIGTATPTAELTVWGDIEYEGVTTDISDRRLKDDIEPLAGALDRVLDLEGVSFVMKRDPNKRIEYGVIAQDVEKVIPELVKTGTDEMQTKSVIYQGFIGWMIEAIKELFYRQEAINDDLQAADRQLASENQDLRDMIQRRDKRIDDLEKRLQRLEKKINSSQSP